MIMQRIISTPVETIKRLPMPIAPPLAPISPSSSVHTRNNSSMPDLLWISKQQQQHPSTHAHPLKNTIRVSSNGTRYKFDGKQWRPLCESPDGYECRNLAFRSSLCQKHFYKMHLYKRPYLKNGHIPSAIPPLALKRPLSDSHEHHYHLPLHQNEHCDMESEHDEMYEDDDSIQVLENNESMIIKGDKFEPKHESQPEFSYFTIDCDPQSDVDHLKSVPFPKTERLNSINNESITSNESENTSLNLSTSKITESMRLGLPPLTRTEEKSIANKLIIQLPADASLMMAEQLARRRACEIVMDNYSHQIPSLNITSEWFYDFLLRNPRVPIHFQSWFSTVKPNIPSSDLLIDIKIWELGLITRSVVPSSSVSTSSSSP